jgi:hypothetical protein
MFKVCFKKIIKTDVICTEFQLTAQFTELVLDMSDYYKEYAGGDH